MTVRSILFGIVAFFSYAASAQTNLYSGGSGNVAAVTWYTSATRVGATAIPNSNSILNIGNNHSVTQPSSATAVTYAGIVVNDNSTSGTFTFGSTGTASSLTVTGHITVNSAGVFQSGGTGGNHNLHLQGDMSNNGSVNFTTGNANHYFNFRGSATRTLSGSGTYLFERIVMNTSGSSNVNINASISLNTDLNFAANGLLILDGNSNIILTTGAAIIGAGALRYVQVDDTSAANGQLIKTTAAAITGGTSWRILYPIGTATGGYTPLDLSTSTFATSPVANSTLAVKAIYNQSVPGQLRRQFRLKVTGNTNNTNFTNGRFSYNSSTDVSTGDVLSSYTLIRYTNSSSVTSITPGVAPGATGFFTPSANLSLATGTTYLSIGSSAVWYTYQNGDWNNWEIWTQDPSGTTLLNAMTQLPLPGDQVVILNGYTVTANINSIMVSTTTIEGGAILDLAATTGHNLGTVDGKGLLRINGTNFPTGTFTSFVSSEGGTVEYYNTSGTLSATQTEYNNLLLTNSSASAVVFTSVNNFSINGNLTISRSGSATVTWQINDNSAANRSISIYGNLNVNAGGQIRVGTGNEGTDATTQHQLTLYGNFNNNGSVKFFDDTDAEFAVANYTAATSNGERVTQNELQGNAVNVLFSGTTNQTVSCNGVTDFYRLIVNKGSGRQAMLTINSSNTANFRLFGPTDRDSNVADGTSVSSNALSIVNGTLQLNGSLSIISLSESTPCNFDIGFCLDPNTPGGGWPIPQNGALWINGANVSVQATNTTDTRDNGRQIYVFGLLQVTQGTLNLGHSRGLLGGGSGVFVMEGGQVNAWQIRTTYLGNNNRFAYIQRGGTVNIGTAGLSGINTGTYPRFALPYSECTFEMSGGIINVASPMSTGTSLDGGILISAASSNIQVTGGTVNAILPASAVDFNVSSTAPFYDFNVLKTGPGASAVILNAISFNDNTGYTRAAQPLVILNNLKLVTGNLPTMNCNGINLTVGGDFEVQSGTTFTSGTNTVTLNGTADQIWTHAGTISQLNNIVVAKTGVLTLAGANTFPNIPGLTLTSGTLNDGGKILTVTNTLSNSATHAGTGRIIADGPTTIAGANGIFGNLDISTNGNVLLSGKQTVSGNLRLTNTNSNVNIGSYNLTVNGALTTTGTAFSSTKRIITKGLRNDGGLTLKGVSGDLLFPVGTSVVAYSPVTINVAATTHGSITVRPVGTAHPNAIPASQSLAYYWRVTSADYAGVSSVVHKSYSYGSTALLNGTLTAYKPARFTYINYTWSIGSTYNASGLTTIPNFSFSTDIDGEYTAGNITPGALIVFFSRQSGQWNTNTTWSNVPCSGAGACGAAVAAGTFPCSTCPVVIGDVENFHTVTLDANNRNSGSLQITNGSTLDCVSFTGLNFGSNTGDAVSGRGTLRISSNVFPSGDFSSFVGSEGGTVEWYGNTKTIPTVGPAPYNVSLATYYNLVVSPNAGQTITMPPLDLTIYNDLSKTGAGIALTNAGATRNLAILRNFNISNGIWNTASGNATNFAVTGTTTVNSGATFRPANNTARTHTFSTAGSIINNGTMVFTDGPHVMNLVFIGTTDALLSGTNASASTTLNNVTMNKGTSKAPKLTIDVAGTLSTPTTGWLTLQNGNIIFNKAAAIFSLHTGTSTFTIPNTVQLTAQSGTVDIIGDAASDAADLVLAGTLEVSGGTVNINREINNRNNNNDIEYSTAGSPTILVSSGALYVNGTVRRPLTSLSGALVYNQSGGTVTIGGRNATAQATRGVFEIENNSGSTFLMSGNGTLTINRSAGNTSSFADIYLNPTVSSVAATSTIQIGMSSGTVTSPLSINIVPAIGNFTILGNTTGQTVNMRSSNLTTNGSLAINSNTTLLTNSLDVTIGGDLTIDGTYDGTIGNGNTTTFTGANAQTAKLSSTSSFENITVDKTSGTVTLAGVSPVINNLNILNGILDVANLGLTVEGDIVNNSLQIGTGQIIMSGPAFTQYITSDNGTFTNLNLEGSSASKNIRVTGDLNIAGTLTFSADNRYLSIGSYQLSFGESASISGATALRFIRTNGAASDLGVQKFWPLGSSSFVYEVGVLNYYTPVTLSLNTTSAGTLNVTAVNQRHATANLGSSEQILNYYWIINRGSTLSYSTSGSHSYVFPSGLITGSGGTLVAGYLDMGDPVGWITSGHGGAATLGTMTFSNQLTMNLPTAGNAFHYTVGTVNTLPNPIVPIYSRLNNASVTDLSVGGDWTSASSWTTSSTGYGSPLGGSPPLGVPVVILANSRINMNANARSALTARIDGLLVLNSTSQHNLGTLSGTGTLRTSTNTFPAGNYTTFVSSAGGTIEYMGPMTMNNRSIYNNLSFSGAGTVVMTNTDLILNGSLNIGSGVTLTNPNNRNISLLRNWTNNGSFSTGTGTVAFNGTTDQTVNGSTTFNNLTLKKPSGNLLLSGTGATDVAATLTLTSGHIVSTSSNMLTLPAASVISGGSASSFIAGPVRKVLNAASSQSFPLGSISPLHYRPASILNTSAGDTWQLQYVPQNPTAAGYDNTAMNTTHIGTVSEFEYWLISRTGTATAGVILSYNTGSYVEPDIDVVANLRVARWDGSRWDLPPGAGAHSQSGDEFSGTVSVSHVSDFSPFTLSSIDFFTSLPISWLSFKAKREDLSVLLEWKTAQERNSVNFEIERSTDDGHTFKKIGEKKAVGNSSVAQNYSFYDVHAFPGQRYYYRLKQIDHDGRFDYSTTVVVFPENSLTKEIWTVFPNPVKAHERIAILPSDISYETDLVLTLTSVNNQLVLSTKGDVQEVSDTLNGLKSSLRSGIYLLTISTGSKKAVYRIVIL